MKTYNIKPDMKEMSFGELSVVALGERGRGRWEEIIPCPLPERKLSTQPCWVHKESISSVVYKDGSVRKDPEGLQEDCDRCNPFDFENFLLEIGETRSGKPKLIKSTSSDGGWIARINTGKTYTRGTRGRASVFNPHSDNVKFLASGYGAFGQAGAIGKWNDYLIAVEQTPTVVRVAPSGGSHKSPRFWLVFLEDKVIKVSNEEVHIFLDQHPEIEDFTVVDQNEFKNKYTELKEKS